MNSRIAEILGYTQDEMLGKHIGDFIFEHDRSDYESHKALMEQGIKGTSEGEYRTKSGAPVWLLISSSPVIEGGKFTGTIIMATDITKRKKAEMALRESKDYLDKIINSIGDPLFVKDRQHRMTLVNDAACKLFDRSREKILGRTAYDLFPTQEMAEISWKKDEEVFNTGVEVVNEETNTYAPGETLTVLVKKTPYMDNVGNQFLVGITRDITDRKLAEDRIIASLQEKEVLLKEIHHRVKNNLQIVSSLLRIQSRYTNDEATADVLKECHNRVRSMALIHEKLYRSENLAGVDFADYVRSLTSYLFLSFGVDRRQINLKLDLDEVLLSIEKAIPCGLILNELVSNCLKHAFPGQRSGEVYIELKHHNANKVLLVVKDNGVGLPDDLDPHKSRTLGLKLVYDLEKQLKGDLQLDLRSGAKFEMIFPIE